MEGGGEIPSDDEDSKEVIDSSDLKFHKTKYLGILYRVGQKSPDTLKHQKRLIIRIFRPIYENKMIGKFYKLSKTVNSFTVSYIVQKL